jgi:predicted secreted hydrolase
VPVEDLSAAMKELHNDDMWFKFRQEQGGVVLTVTAKDQGKLQTVTNRELMLEATLNCARRCTRPRQASAC